MLIAGAQMNVMTKAVGVASHNEQRFAMRIQADYAVNDMRAGFLELACPVNIGSFIKPDAQLDQSSDLLPCRRCVHQGLDNRRLTAGTIKSNLDREHLRILRSLFDQLDSWIETFVGMMQKHVPPAHDFKNIHMLGKRRITRGLEWPVPQICERIVRYQRHEMRH